MLLLGEGAKHNLNPIFLMLSMLAAMGNLAQPIQDSMDTHRYNRIPLIISDAPFLNKLSNTLTTQIADTQYSLEKF